MKKDFPFPHFNYPIIIAAHIPNSVPGFSQESQGPQAITITDIQLKHGTQIEFEKFLRDDVIPAMKKGSVQELSVWRTAVLVQGGNYILASPMENFAEFDKPHPLVIAIGPYGLEVMMTKMQRFAASAHTSMLVELPELAIATPSGYVPKIGFQVKATIAPGRNEEYEKNTKVITEILKKTNAKGFYADKVGIGGNPDQYYFLVLLDSFADMDAFGQTFSKLVYETKLPSTVGIVTLMEYSMYSYVPELSIQPAAQ